MKMTLKRMICKILTSALLIGLLGVTGSAADKENLQAATFSVQRATNQFSFKISGNTWMKADKTFSLAPKDSVNINASYEPGSASVDFGLIDSNGIYHYINTTNGSVNHTIQIDEWGNYTFAIRNNSSYTVNVSGFVNY